MELFVFFLGVAIVCFQAMLDAVISLQFSTVETIWRHFWRSANNNEAVDVGMEEDPEKMLPKYAGQEKKRETMDIDRSIWMDGWLT